MIFDLLTYAHLYTALTPGITAAFRYCAETDFSVLSPGRHPIDGDRIFALASDYPTKPRESGILEAHRRYVDVQYLVSGREMIGYCPTAWCTPRPYDDARDLMFLQGSPDFMLLTPDVFAIFWPQDAHMPGIAVDKPEPVRKVVIKVAVGG
jgi:biofilm protein TabA